MGVTVKREKKDGETTIFDGEIKGTPCLILSVKKGSEDRESMKKIFGSIKGEPIAEGETLSLEVGPIWNNDQTKKRCPEVLENWLKANAEWYERWLPTVQEKMSICTVKVKSKHGSRTV